MSIIWTLIVGGIIGWLAGFIGSWLGGLILGSWGPVIGGFAIIPTIIGSVVLVLIVSFILRKMGQNKNHGRHAK
ncbi:GlsB/YeaQ/YmgE family stress response membrane protein [Priestia sp. D51]